MNAQAQAVQPVAALKEIAFWLERERASDFKVQAFRKAAAALSAMEPPEIAARARDGSLAKVRGIGGSTLAVVQQAVEGEVPDYLATLRDRGSEPLAEEGRELRAQLRGDLHVHSDWTDGTTPIDDMVETGRALGREYLALTDHSPSLRIANGLTAERLTEQLGVVAAMNRQFDGFRLLPGIEVDILENGDLDQTDDMLGRLDIVVASVHSKLRMDAAEMTGRMIAAIENRHTTVLGHCTGRLVEGSRGVRPQSQFDAAKVFAACAREGVAVELNSRPERRDPPSALIRLALDAGCYFSIDTDSHAPGQLEFLDYGAERAAENGVPADRIITTWPVERLLEFSHARR